MRFTTYLCSAVILALSAVAQVAMAKEVTLPYKGLTLNGNLELAHEKKLSDGVVLITHGGLMARDMDLYVYLQHLLKDRGYSSIAINLSLGINNRHGRYDCKATHKHHYTDAPKEIGAWVNWLKQQGVKKIILLGHSRGGAETALFASEDNDPVIKSVVLLAPDTHETNDATAYEKHHHKKLQPILKKAEKLVSEGKANTIMHHVDFLYCSDTSTTASTFVSYYGPDPRLDTAYLVPKIKKPVLIVLAGSDQIVVNDKKFLPLDKLKNVEVTSVDGAGHFFRDLYADDAMDAINSFIESKN
jgi:pimeloyl-ACP methyl ester carboxylesterase